MEEFIIGRVDTAESAYRAGLMANYPSPEDLRSEALFLGIENSISEYVESMLDEVPGLNHKICKSPKRKMLLEELTNGALPIFYDRISIPYVESMDGMDEALIKYLNEQLELITF